MQVEGKVKWRVKSEEEVRKRAMFSGGAGWR